MSNFVKVTRDNPCPICERTDWCKVSPDGAMALCARIEQGSIKACGTKGAGWLHRVSGEVKPMPYRKPRKYTPPPDFLKLQKQYESALSSGSLQRLSISLGVSTKSLLRLEIGWDGRNYTFPMRNGHTRILGMRIRGTKGMWAITGGMNALFWPVGVELGSREPLWIAEGPTDVATLLDLGFDAIGRASCSTGTNDIKIILEQDRRQVFIMTDKDNPKKRPHSDEVFFPGQEGSKRLAEAIKSLTNGVKCVKPPLRGDDIRAWVNRGATREDVLEYAKNTRFE